MKTIAWFASLVTLPIIIDSPGMYKTRCGQSIRIEVNDYPTQPNTFGWYGRYLGEETAIFDTWHRSGRLYFGQLSDNDIVEKISSEVNPVPQ